MPTTSDSRRTPRPAPAFLRIATALRERIEAGELEANAPLPPERELCVEFDVSRMTARRALVLLESEGLVYRSATRGTFVSEPRVPLRVGSFSHEIARSGRQATAEVIWAEEHPASARTADALGLADGAPVAALQRLRRSNGEPLALETTSYPSELVPGLLERDLTGSLWDELHRHHDLHLTRTVAELEVVALDAETSALLESRPGAPGLLLVRHSYDRAGRCLEYARDVYRADRVSLVIERSFDES